MILYNFMKKFDKQKEKNGWYGALCFTVKNIELTIKDHMF